ncbi:MAG: hypothetical protein DMG99_12605 [Acidobacteria bacterium]|nr:MAG: hypothetical protein DMG99_12605 [Acidobacteriota bacterium]
MSLLPVRAEPPAPAPAPAANPIAAPLPPPTRPPMIPPKAAPPPVATAVRLPFPFWLNVRSAAATCTLLMESKRTCRTAPPANFPSGFASVTVPLTLAP